MGFVVSICVCDDEDVDGDDDGFVIKFVFEIVLRIMFRNESDSVAGDVERSTVLSIRLPTNCCLFSDAICSASVLFSMSSYSVVRL